MNKIGKINVNVKVGDVTAESVDCIVVPQFRSEASYGGVGRSIYGAGMRKGLELYDDIVNANPLNYGDAVITESGRDGVWLAHVATAGANEDTLFKAVYEAIFNALKVARAKGVKSIAIPELGTRVIGFLTQEQSAKAMLGGVMQFTSIFENAGIENITICVFRGSTAPAEQVLARISEMDVNLFEKGEKEFDFDAWVAEMCLNASVNQ